MQEIVFTFPYLVGARPPRAELRDPEGHREREEAPACGEGGHRVQGPRDFPRAAQRRARPAHLQHGEQARQDRRQGRRDARHIPAEERVPEPRHSPQRLERSPHRHADARRVQVQDGLHGRRQEDSPRVRVRPQDR